MAAVRFLSVRWPVAAEREADEVKRPRPVLVAVPPDASRIVVRGGVLFTATQWPAGLRPQDTFCTASPTLEPSCRAVVRAPVTRDVAPVVEKETVPFAVQLPVVSRPAGQPTAAASLASASRSLVVERAVRASVAAGGATVLLRASPSFGLRFEALLGVAECVVLPPPVVGREQLREASGLFFVRR